MEINAGGSCRGTIYPEAIGAAAAALRGTEGEYCYMTRSRPLHAYPTPTIHRAEITAIILALDLALERFRRLEEPRPGFHVKVYSSCKYVVDCMTVWKRQWTRNGSMICAGFEVPGQDLLQEAFDLEAKVKELGGAATFAYIPREENEYVKSLCVGILDRQRY